MPKLTAKEVASNVTDFLNTFNTKEKTKEFCEAMSTEHRTLQQAFTGLCLGWIEFMGNSDPNFVRRNFDARNASSNEVCIKLVEFMEENNIPTNLPCV